jgi:TolB-like protein/class 3 adenylate cyclase/Tfp pilus assembly protein PilF
MIAWPGGAMKQPVERRLAAILAADVAGYSRLIGADEEGTHERLKAHLGELVDPKVKEHHGRIVKNTGDGMLAEFASVVNALRCATEVQAGMAERNATTPPDHRIEFRIGVHQGDVIIEEHDIFGDAVNVAARLEGLAEPGGICVSARVRGDAAGKLDLAFEDMGQQQLKNIGRPVRVYALGPEAVPASTPPAVSISQPVAAPRLSIVVLPFANLSSDPEQQYFAEGITEDLTTDLSRIAGMLVISRNTAFTYQGKRIDTKQIGRELGVRYVLEGSVRRLGSQLRISAQLIDAETDAHLWAERFDRDTGDHFALQDEITSRIANALNIELIAAEAARPTEHPDALDYILRGRAAKLKPESRASFAEAISLFEGALTLDPQSVEAQTCLAGTLVGLRVFYGTSDLVAANLARADALIRRALASAPRYAFAHYVKGQVLRAQGRYEDAIVEYETALASNPNLVVASNGLGWCKLFVGSIDEVIPLMQQAIRRSPRDPQVGVWHGAIGMVHMLQSRIDEAIVWFERARSASPEKPYNHLHLAAVYALSGDLERAVMELAEARRLDGGTLYSSIAHLKAFPGPWWGALKTRSLYETAYFAGLRKAGMPEE